MKLAMVVDSDQVTSAMVCRTLRAAGYRVKTAEGMHAALVEIEQDNPEIVFSEISLVDGNGISLLFECRLLLPELRFVLMARQPSTEMSIEAMRSGVSDILLKPVTGSAISAALLRMPKYERRGLAPSMLVSAPVVEAELNADCVSVAFGGGLKQIKRTVVQAALRRYDGNKSATARALGIPRRSLYRLLGDK